MIEQALRELNPVRDERVAYDPDRAAADLERILGLPRPASISARRAPRHAHGRRLVVIAVASVAALVLVLGLPFMPWRTVAPAFAATPPLLSGELAAGVSGDQARAELLRIADAADRAGAPETLGATFSTWSLSMRIHGGEPLVSTVVPLRVTFEVGADLSAHYTSVYQAPIAGDAGADRVPEPGTVEVDWTQASGALTFPRDLSGDPAVLVEQLSASRPNVTSDPAGLALAMSDLSKERTPGAKVRGALCRLLAQTKGIEALGRIRDRAGRLGSAFAVTSDLSGLPTRYVVMLDPRSGRLLALEQVLTTDAGKLNVTLPAVIDYTVFD